MTAAPSATAAPAPEAGGLPARVDGPSRVRRLWRGERPLLIAYGVLVAVLAAYVAIEPGVLTLSELNIQTTAALALICVAAGQTIVMLAGGIDLSVGGVVSLATCLAATRMPEAGAGIVVWAVLILGIGVVAGLGNGLVVAYVGVAPFIVTLATWSILNGIALLVLATPGGEVPLSLLDASTAELAGIAVPVLVLAALVAFWLWGRATRTMSRLRAVGSDAGAAHLAGVPVARYRVLSYMLSGGLAAFGGLVLVTQLGAGDPTVGTSFVLDSVAAAVIGGAALTGGRGDVLGAVAGAFVLTLLGSVIFVLELPTYWQTIAIGVLLVVAALSGALVQRRGELGASA